MRVAAELLQFSPYRVTGYVEVRGARPNSDLARYLDRSSARSIVRSAIQHHAKKLFVHLSLLGIVCLALWPLIAFVAASLSGPRVVSATDLVTLLDGQPLGVLGSSGRWLALNGVGRMHRVSKSEFPLRRNNLEFRVRPKHKQKWTSEWGLEPVACWISLWTFHHVPMSFVPPFLYDKADHCSALGFMFLRFWCQPVIIISRSSIYRPSG